LGEADGSFEIHARVIRKSSDAITYSVKGGLVQQVARFVYRFRLVTRRTHQDYEYGQQARQTVAKIHKTKLTDFDEPGYDNILTEAHFNKNTFARVFPPP
jgi:hypothetical protein